MAAWTPSHSSDDEPLFRVQGYPVGVTEFLIGLYSVFFVALALSLAAGHGAWSQYLAFSTSDIRERGWVWQLATYPLCNAPGRGIWFVVEMLMLFWFGREVERAVGRRAYVLLYLGLSIVPALLFLGVSMTTGKPFFNSGSNDLHFAVFLAFALLFPDSRLAFGLITKWVALVFLVVLSLADMAQHQWAALGWMWTGAAVAAFAIRIPFLSRFGEWMEERQEQAALEQRQKEFTAKREAEERRHQSIDPILEKISKHGMQSLTKDERAVLERARLELLKREGRK